jgi:hypothetical protein
MSVTSYFLKHQTVSALDTYWCTTEVVTAVSEWHIKGAHTYEHGTSQHNQMATFMSNTQNNLNINYDPGLLVGALGNKSPDCLGTNSLTPIFVFLQVQTQLLNAIINPVHGILKGCDTM